MTHVLCVRFSVLKFDTCASRVPLKSFEVTHRASVSQHSQRRESDLRLRLSAWFSHAAQRALAAARLSHMKEHAQWTLSTRCIANSIVRELLAQCATD